jgi:hypothetical protein
MLVPDAPLVLHVTLRWRDDVIAFRRLQGEGAAAVGAHPDALAPIPCAPALDAGFVFARVSAGRATSFAPDGSTATVWRAGGRVDLVEGPAAVALSAGDRAELSFGAFQLAASADVPEALPCGGKRRPAGAWGALAAAALAHVVALGLAARDAQASSADDVAEERASALAGMLASAERRARAGDAPVEDGMGSGEGRETNGRRGDGRLGGGAKALGEEGAMGDRLGRPGAQRRYAVPERVRSDPDPSAARAQALADAAQFGMIGLLGQGPAVPTAPFADAWAHGADALAARGAMWARLPGEAFGEAGLGLTGIGEGGGGSGQGIGLGRVGTLGHTDGAVGPGTGGEGSLMGGSGVWGGAIGGIGIGGVGIGGIGIGHPGLGTHRAVGPAYCRCGATQVSGRLPPEAIQRIVRQNFGRFRACYEPALQSNPNLQGTVTTRFVIGRDGAVASAVDGGSDLPDARVAACVVRAFSGVSFPQPEGGIVTVTYPIRFSPG